MEKSVTFEILVIIGLMVPFASTVTVKTPYMNYYSNEDILERSESGIPFNGGYQVIEREYYPQSNAGFGSGGFSGSSFGSGFNRGIVNGIGMGFNRGFGSNFDSGKYIGGGMNRGQFMNSGISSGMTDSGFGYVRPMGIGHTGVIRSGYTPSVSTGVSAAVPISTSGGYFNKNAFADENKNQKGQSYEKAQGSKGETIKQGSEGFNQGQIALKNNKADSGYYNDEQAAQNKHDDGKQYQGSKHVDQSGKNEGHANKKSGFRKGHSTKGFKTSHHKDESEKTETFYDEANDEADNAHFTGNGGTYGEKEESSYKGGHQNGEFKAAGQGKQGNYEVANVLDNNKADKGQYGQQSYVNNGEVYGKNNGAGQHSLLGVQEANQEYKHHGIKYVPVYGGY